MPIAPGLDPGIAEFARKRSRTRIAFELALSYGLILLVIWTPRPYQKWLWWVAATTVVVVAALSFPGWRALGLRGHNLFHSLWVIGVALVLAAIAILVAAHLDTFHVPSGGFPAFIKTYWAYALWAGGQQLLLQGFFLPRCLALTRSRRWGAIAASVLFALAHLPNPILTPITMVWGLAACAVFLRYHNLFPLAFAHAIFGITIALTIPGPVDHNMRVGLGYLRYRHHEHRTPYALPHPAPQA
jgi:membrane protease YdiL (CAAX protease family)